MLGKDGIIALFKEKTSYLFRKKNWYLIVLLAGTIAGALIMYFLPNVINTPLRES